MSKIKFNFKTKLIIAILIGSLLMVATGCNKLSTTTETLTDNVIFQGDSKKDIIKDKSLTEASSKFGIEVFKEEVKNNKENENIIISPLSLFTALNIIGNGAEGETKKQIKHTLNIENFSDDEVNVKMNGIINYFNNYERGGRDFSDGETNAKINEVIKGQNNYEKEQKTGFIKIYNSIWFDKNFKIKDDFINKSKKYYDSDIFKESLQTKVAVDNMNKWISERSSGLIKNPISEIDENTYMTIFNMLHFKGKWIEPFSKQGTKSEKFYLASADSIDVKMMNSERTMSYYEDESAQAGNFNYYNGSMTILIPKGNINNFVSKLNIETVDKYSNNCRKVEAKIKIPVFKVEYKNSLISTLNTLGMTQAFQPENANFNNIKDNKDPLWIGSLMHNSVVNVDEEGTEAAALTSLHLCGSAPPPKEIKEFYANKPFIFIIQHNDIILFIGKVESPA